MVCFTPKSIKDNVYNKILILFVQSTGIHASFTEASHIKHASNCS